MSQADTEARNKILCCSPTAAGLSVAIIEFILCILSLYGLARNLSIFGPSYYIWFLVGLVSMIVIISVVILLCYAVKKGDARLLIPHMFAQIFLILFLVIVAFVAFLLLIFESYQGIRRLLGHGSYHMSDYDTQYVGVLIIIIYLIVAALEAFLFYVVYKLYKSMKSYSHINVNEPFMYSPVYKAKWQTATKEAPNGYGSPDSGDIYPYG